MATALALLLVALAWPAGGRAEDSQARAETEAAPATPAQWAAGEAPAGMDVDQPPTTGGVLKARVPRPRIQRVPGQGIEQTVVRLTRALGLDTTQQARLRAILWDEQKQARQLRGNPGPGVDWPSMTAAIVNQTKARIRVMLTDEQKSKYPVDVPREGLAPAQADLQHYLHLQDSMRQQEGEAAK